MDCECATILLSWNDQAGTAGMVKGLINSISNEDLIIVVDNGSITPFVNEIIDRRIVVIRSDHNLGYSGGTNLGIEQALSCDASYILLLNSDVEFSKPVYERLFAVLEEDSRIGGVGPVLVERDLRYYGGKDIGLHLNTRKRSISDMSLGTYIPGTAIFLRADAVKRTGRFDEAFFFSGEVADYCRRMQSLGYLLKVLSDVEVVHHIEESSVKLRGTLYVYYNLRNRFLYIEKHHNKRRRALRLRWLSIVGRQIFGAMISLHYSKARAVFWAGYDGICGNFGNRNDRFIKR